MMIKMVGTMMLPKSAIEVFTFPSSELRVASTGHMNTPHERPNPPISQQLGLYFTTAIQFEQNKHCSTVCYDITAINK